MSEKKNIDRLFQEKFKDHEAQPAEDLWSGIEAKLDRKERRRVIPFWWKLSGVAAVFLVGLLIGKMAFSNDVAPTDPIVIDANGHPMKENENGTKKDIQTEIAPKSEATVEAVSEKDGTDNASPKVEATIDAVVKNTAPEHQKSGRNSKGLPSVQHSKSGIAQQGKSGNNSSKDKLNQTSNTASDHKITLEENQQEVAVGKEKNNQTLSSGNPVAESNDKNNNTSKETNPLAIKKDINLDDLKGGNNSKIATKELDNKLNDSAKNKAVAKNELEELLTEKEQKLKQESKLNRWQLTSNVAPIFLGSATNGSPIDSTFTNNSKSYNTGVGFGLGVTYAVNKKLSVRTGLNKFNMSYNTNDIVFFAGMESRLLDNVNPTAAATRIQVEDDNNLAFSTSTASEAGLLPFESSIVHKNKGYINQEMGYIEMPVEMTYALIDKKFGFKIIGGFSTLFLEDNRISVVSENRTTVLGEANNLNQVHFSTNIGLGLKYGFMKSFEFNVEPTFKYQLNTFSSGAGNFKPYLFGIYSGISYKF